MTIPLNRKPVPHCRMSLYVSICIHVSYSPRYKERLDLKFMKHGRNSGCLDGRKWTLLAGNMDDFRTGVPAQTTGGSMVTKVCASRM